MLLRLKAPCIGADGVWREAFNTSSCETKLASSPEVARILREFAVIMEEKFCDIADELMAARGTDTVSASVVLPDGRELELKLME